MSFLHSISLGLNSHYLAKFPTRWHSKNRIIKSGPHVWEWLIGYINPSYLSINITINDIILSQQSHKDHLLEIHAVAGMNNQNSSSSIFYPRALVLFQQVVVLTGRENGIQNVFLEKMSNNEDHTLEFIFGRIWHTLRARACTHIHTYGITYMNRQFR